MSKVRLSRPVAVLSAKVPPEVYSIIEAKARERGMYVSQFVRHILTSVALGLQGVNVSNINQPIIVNVNIPIAQANGNTLNTDTEITREYVQALKDDLRKAKEVIRKKNEEIKRLQRLLDNVRKFARVGDIRSIRRVLGVA